MNVNQEPEIESLGKTIRRMRNELEMTQKQLADECGIDESTISKIEKGYTTSIPTLQQIATALKATLEIKLKK